MIVKTPLVSVVLPIYNVEKYLNRCITSVVNQTYKELEIILVDDGSPDNCPRMCDEWACRDSRIKVIHKENAGLGMARNTGIEHASGSYICFFDSDDYIALDTIEKAYGLAAEHGAEIVIFGVSNVNSHGRIFRKFPLEAQKTCFQGEEVQNQFLPDLIDCRHRDVKNKNLCLSAWACLYSMELIRRTGWRFVSERKNISEDSYSLIWLYKYVSKVAIVQEPLYYHCENGASLTRTYRPDRFERIKNFYSETAAMAKEQEFPEVVQTRIAGLFLSFTIAAMKQIAAADMSNKQKLQMIKKIITDAMVQQVLADPRCCYSSKARKVLFWSMRKKLHVSVWLCILLQSWQEEKRKATDCS